MKVVRIFCLAAVVLGLIFALPGFAQSVTSGDLGGVVTDPSGAVVPNAKITATSDATGAVHTATTNGDGSYRISFLQPGSYTVVVNAAGFQQTTHKVQVAVGQAANGNIALAVTGGSTVVEVTTAPTQIDNADLSTNFSQQQISLVPNPGNDLSAVAQTSPGVVMNTQGGFGNFSSFGLPGTSNLFTLDGQNDNDPFLNLNNSGATNLLLGANEIQEATVTSNGYSGQFGQLAGAQVNYVTKSGGNQFHGNAVYYWNGRVMNANDFINNETSTKKPFDNVNQWATSFGGPIVKDKTFFFWDYEGLRVVLPTSSPAFIPSPAFETATLNNLATHTDITTGKPLSASIPFYQNIFNLYNTAPGAAGATPSANCPVSIPSLAGTPCVLTFRSTAGNFTHEYLMALRIDHKFNDNNSIFGRVQTDRGVQATITDPINSVFNVQSNQPEYQGQMGWTHIVNSNSVNEFKISGQWYTAIFTNPSRAATLAAFPTTLQFGDGSFSNLGGALGEIFPQGRNVTQYQAVDDYSWTHGNHTWKFGVNFHRNLVTDYNPQEFTAGFVEPFTITDFFNGGSTSLVNSAAKAGDIIQQNFPTRLTQPINVYGLGVYGQDEWRVTKKLKLTLALRLDHNSNPVCVTDCFARLASPFTTLNHTNSANIPYNQTILTGQSQAYPGTDIVVWQPRIGLTWSPFASNKTVIRAGGGIFGDSFPATVADTLLGNAPTQSTFVVPGAAISTAQPGNLFTLASNANQSFQNAFATGGTFNSISLANPFFAAPGFTTTDPRVRQPRYQEWNLEVQQELPWSTVLSVNYVGNHGIFEPVQNNGLNAFGFGNLPATVPDARFGTVNQIQSIAVSNYNGLVASLRHQFNRGFAFQINYTWSHALDEISNGGILPFNNTTNVSLSNPTDPFNLRQMYGSADYDVRHYFSANYVWENSLRHLFHWGPNAIFSGWTFSGTVFSRSGLPFSVIDNGLSQGLRGNNYGGFVLATVTGPTTTATSCGGDATSALNSPCLNTAGFLAPGSETGFGNQSRNSFRGPNYFDTDFTVMKTVKLRERASLGFGVQFFNLLNHPNFDQPINDISNANNQFGLIQRTVNTPTSILGSFLGGDASPRLIQLKAEFKF
ncbi:MAG TPA: TonB-dependent receptor [Candidatus Angelobacter sp.]|nr:TonB-dependent receptor [Candidatus Angelobacter sp.]